MGLVQIFSQISRIDKALLETEGWNKKDKNQLRNNNDFYVWEISQGLRFVSNKDCIKVCLKNIWKSRGLALFFNFFREDFVTHKKLEFTPIRMSFSWLGLAFSKVKYNTYVGFEF